MKKLQSNKGFTLVELIIVIAILAIIMLIAVPNLSGIQQRMQVRADKATAAQIAKAVRVWYSDNMASDIASERTIADNLTTTAQLYSGLEELCPNYCSDSYRPTSLLTTDGTKEEYQGYYVGLSSANRSEAKIVVLIAKAQKGDTEGTIKAADTVPTIEENPTVDYTGAAGSVAYVEP